MSIGVREGGGRLIVGSTFGGCAAYTSYQQGLSLVFMAPDLIKPVILKKKKKKKNKRKKKKNKKSNRPHPLNIHSPTWSCTWWHPGSEPCDNILIKVLYIDFNPWNLKWCVTVSTVSFPFLHLPIIAQLTSFAWFKQDGSSKQTYLPTDIKTSSPWKYWTELLESAPNTCHFILSTKAQLQVASRVLVALVYRSKSKCLWFCKLNTAVDLDGILSTYLVYTFRLQVHSNILLLVLHHRERKRRKKWTSNRLPNTFQVIATLTVRFAGLDWKLWEVISRNSG